MSAGVRSARGQIVMSPAHCASLVTRLALQNPPDPSHTLFRRERYRWILQSPAIIRHPGPDGKDVTVDAKVADISVSGVGLLSQQSVPAGGTADVFVVAEGKTYSAVVRVLHTTQSADGYRIGCEFVIREEP